MATMAAAKEDLWFTMSAPTGATDSNTVRRNHNIRHSNNKNGINRPPVDSERTITPSNADENNNQTKSTMITPISSYGSMYTCPAPVTPSPKNGERWTFEDHATATINSTDQSTTPPAISTTHTVSRQSERRERIDGEEAMKDKPWEAGNATNPWRTERSTPVWSRTLLETPSSSNDERNDNKEDEMMHLLQGAMHEITQRIVNPWGAESAEPCGPARDAVKEWIVEIDRSHVPRVWKVGTSFIHHLLEEPSEPASTNNSTHREDQETKGTPFTVDLLEPEELIARNQQKVRKNEDSIILHPTAETSVTPIPQYAETERKKYNQQVVEIIQKIDSIRRELMKQTNTRMLNTTKCRTPYWQRRLRDPRKSGKATRELRLHNLGEQQTKDETPQQFTTGHRRRQSEGTIAECTPQGPSRAFSKLVLEFMIRLFQMK